MSNQLAVIGFVGQDHVSIALKIPQQDRKFFIAGEDFQTRGIQTVEGL